MSLTKKKLKDALDALDALKKSRQKQSQTHSTPQSNPEDENIKQKKDLVNQLSKKLTAINQELDDKQSELNVTPSSIKTIEKNNQEIVQLKIDLKKQLELLKNAIADTRPNSSPSYSTPINDSGIPQAPQAPAFDIPTAPDTPPIAPQAPVFDIPAAPDAPAIAATLDTTTTASKNSSPKPRESKSNTAISTPTGADLTEALKNPPQLKPRTENSSIRKITKEEKIKEFELDIERKEKLLHDKMEKLQKINQQIANSSLEKDSTVLQEILEKQNKIIKSLKADIENLKEKQEELANKKQSIREIVQAKQAEALVASTATAMALNISADIPAAPMAPPDAPPPPAPEAPTAPPPPAPPEPPPTIAEQRAQKKAIISNESSEASLRAVLKQRVTSRRKDIQGKPEKIDLDPKLFEYKKKLRTLKELLTAKNKNLSKKDKEFLDNANKNTSPQDFPAEYKLLLDQDKKQQLENDKQKEELARKERLAEKEKTDDRKNEESKKRVEILIGKNPPVNPFEANQEQATQFLEEKITSLAKIDLTRNDIDITGTDITEALQNLDKISVIAPSPSAIPSATIINADVDAPQNTQQASGNPSVPTSDTEILNSPPSQPSPPPPTISTEKSLEPDEQAPPLKTVPNPEDEDKKLPTSGPNPHAGPLMNNPSPEPNPISISIPTSQSAPQGSPVINEPINGPLEPEKPLGFFGKLKAAWNYFKNFVVDTFTSIKNAFGFGSSKPASPEQAEQTEQLRKSSTTEDSHTLDKKQKPTGPDREQRLAEKVINRSSQSVPEISTLSSTEIPALPVTVQTLDQSPDDPKSKKDLNKPKA
ncbi:MAG: hypothetical protein ACKOAD_03890 [Gammaproteobacteria bacterium]